jgi:hypothetical protein
MNSLRLLASLIFLTVANALNPTQQFCSNGLPCTVFDHNFLTTQSVHVGSQTTVINTESYGTFTRAVVQTNAMKNNFIFYTTAVSSIDCSNSIGVLFEENGGDRALSEVNFVQNTAISCLLNFTKKISTTDLQKRMNLVIGFGQGISSKVSSIGVLIREPIVPALLPMHIWSISPDYTQHMGIKLALNIQRQSLNDDAGCSLSSTNPNLYKVYLSDSMFIPNPQSCQFTAKTVRALSSTALSAEFSLSQYQYWGCSKQYSFLNQVHNYKLEVKPIIASCSYYENYAVYKPQVYINQYVVQGPYGPIFYMSMSVANS